MALTVVDEPVEIVLARNQAVLQLRAAQTPGGDLYSAVGVNASLSILLTDRFAAGETLTLDYEDPDGTTESIEFTAAGAYDPEADEIPDDTWAGTNAAYWIEVAAILNEHPRIAPFFTVEPVTIMGSLYIRATAKNTVPGWDVSMSNTGGFSTATDAGSADATPDNYRVLVEVFFEKTYREGDYERVAQLEGQPDTATGWLYFDVSDILAAQCRATRTEPLVPVYGTTVPALADNLRRYFIRYTEEYGSPAEVQAWAYTDVKFCMDGGVSQAVHAESGYFGYLSEKSAGNAFLTWMPDGRVVSIAEPQYLSWYNYTGSTKMVMIQVVEYDVDTGAVAETSYTLADGPSVRDKETIIFPVGLWNIGTYNADCFKVAVRVVDFDSDWEGGSPEFLSESRIYYIDRNYQEGIRYVQYLNGFGVPESVRCTGEWTKRLEVRRETASRSLTPGYSSLASDNFQYARDFAPTFVYRTGYLRKADAEVLQEVLIAGEVYDSSSDGYIPLLLTSNTFEVTSTRETLHSYQFAARARMDMKNFSKKTVTAGTSDAWQETNDDSWFDALLLPWLE